MVTLRLMMRDRRESADRLGGSLFNTELGRFYDRMIGASGTGIDGVQGQLALWKAFWTKDYCERSLNVPSAVTVVNEPHLHVAEHTLTEESVGLCLAASHGEPFRGH